MKEKTKKKIEIVNHPEYFFDDEFDPHKITFYGIGLGDSENRIDSATIDEPKNDAGWISTIYDVGYRIANGKVAGLAIHNDLIKKLGLLREKDEITIKFGEPDKIELGMLGREEYHYINKGLTLNFFSQNNFHITIVGN